MTRPLTPPAPGPTCQRCHKAISGPHVQALAARWHPGCWCCSACGKPLEQAFVERGGQAFHPACHEQRFGLRCSVCGEPIQGEYFQVEGKPVCGKDYRAGIGARCCVCDQVLTGAFVGNGFGQQACARHRQIPTCASCDRWLNEVEQAKGLFATYGTPLCTSCGAGAIDADALGRYDNAFGVAALANLGLKLGPLPAIPIRLDSLTQIRLLQSPIEAQAEGLTQTFLATRDGRETSRGITAILMVGGLAREHFEGVLAHEFGHVWLFQERLGHLQGAVAEGFCELVKHHWLARLATPLARELQDKQARNPDPIYGEGFRRYKARWDGAGSQGVLELLQG